MGKVYSSLVRRPAKNWNIENRAHALIDKQSKPAPAPRHPTTQEALEKFNEEHPEIRSSQMKKNEKLDSMLRGLTVEPPRMGEIVSTARKDLLPKNRAMVADDEFGYLEPDVIRPGRCSIRQAQRFISDHHTDTQKHSVANIAKEYNLDEQRVDIILKYFNVFNIQVPKASVSSEEAHGILAHATSLKPKFFRNSENKDKDSSDSKHSLPGTEQK